MKKNEYYVKFKRDGKNVELIITAYSKHQIEKHFHWSADFITFEIANDKDKKRKNVHFEEFSESTPEETMVEIIEGSKENADLLRSQFHESIECTYKRLAECKELGAWDYAVSDELKHHSDRAQHFEEYYNNAFSEYCNLKRLYKELFGKEYKEA